MKHLVNLEDKQGRNDVEGRLKAYHSKVDRSFGEFVRETQQIEKVAIGWHRR